MMCSVGSSLPFWKIAHQKMVDLSCLAMVYIRTIETGCGIDNQVIGSGSKSFLFWLRVLPIFYLGVRRKKQLKETGEHYA